MTLERKEVLVYSNGKKLDIPSCVLDLYDSGYCGVGPIDDDTALKWPMLQDDPDEGAHCMASIQLEAQAYEAIGSCEHVIGFKGHGPANGLLLERAIKGSITGYLKEHKVEEAQKLIWIDQLAQAFAVSHRAGVIHGDIGTNNILLDQDLRVKLCDFQGRVTFTDGRAPIDGDSTYSTKAEMPHEGELVLSVKTDIFAFASTSAKILLGHEIWPELDKWKYEDEQEIERRSAAGIFPVIDHPINSILQKCWSQGYESFDMIIQDLGSIVSAETL